jgi:hypothetical protein
MADTETATTETETTTETTEDAAKENDGNLGDGGKKALAAEREARKAAEKAYQDSQKSIADLTAKVKSFEDRDKTAEQKNAERIAELEKALADKDTALVKRDREATRAQVAVDKGVPLKLVTGSTREEMEAAADAALEWRGTKQDKNPLRQQGPRSGAGAPPDGSTLKEKAAASLRAMRAGQ